MVEDISFPSGGHQVAGKFCPATAPRPPARGGAPPAGERSGSRAPVALLVPGFPGFHGMLGLEDVLPEAGLACLTFRYSGIDPSEGTFGFGQSLDDVGAAVDWLRRTPPS